MESLSLHGEWSGKMTDRADKIAGTELLDDFGYIKDQCEVAEIIRAYGDERYKQGRAVGLRESTNYGEGRLAGLEEAAVAAMSIWAVGMEPLRDAVGEAIRALKEKP
jgi:hypothetical protein